MPRARHDPLARTLGLLDTAALVVGSIVGAGIFATAGDVAAALPHPGWMLAAWIVGGLLSIAGALVNAEMAASLPHAGGDYVYLSEAYHPCVGFLAGWGSFFAIYAGTVATLAVGLTEYLAVFVPAAGHGPWVALAAVLVSSWLNYRGTLVGARVQTIVTVLKVAAIGAFVVAAPLLGAGNVSLRGLAAGDATAIGPSAFALALIPILFAYLGWNAPVFVASEIRDPDRTLPRAIFAGTLVCIVLYVATNLVYLSAVPVDEMAGQVRVAEMAARRLFGPLGATLVSLLVVLSIAGCLHATVLVGPRIVYAMALDGLFARRLARVHQHRATPHVAIAVQAIVACLLIVGWGTFTRLLTYTTFAIVVFATLDALAIYLLRWRLPDLRRPYRAWGYPWVPAVYVATNLWLVVATLLARPVEAVGVLVIVATGLPVYILYARGHAT